MRNSVTTNNYIINDTTKNLKLNTMIDIKTYFDQVPCDSFLLLHL